MIVSSVSDLDCSIPSRACWMEQVDPPHIMENPTEKPAEVASSAGEQENQMGEDDENYDSAVEVKPLHARKKTTFPKEAFAVECDRCFKWRCIHTKEKYEEIREHILERPFYCETTREWRSDKSCDDPPDLTQNGSILWAIDKPSIAQPPPQWERLIKIRPEGGMRFADVYYDSPSGKRLRSNNEVQRYLDQHPEYAAQGVKLNNFSFDIPKPLQEQYVKKHRPAPSHDINGAYDEIKWYEDEEFQSKNKLKEKEKKSGDKWGHNDFPPKKRKKANKSCS